MKHFKPTITTEPTVRVMRNRIESVLVLAEPDEYLYGLQWYRHANEWAQTVANDHNITVQQVAQITAILSAQQEWSKNQFNVGLFLRTGVNAKMFATMKQKDECSMVLADTFRLPASRPKTFAFSSCIADPSSDLVVIDRHAIKIAWGALSAEPIGITKARYRNASAAYNLIAQDYSLQAHQVQAITWVTYKRIVNR